MIYDVTLSRKQLISLCFIFFCVSCRPITLTPRPEAAAPVARNDRWAKLSQASDIRDTLQAIADIDLQTTGTRYHFKAALLLKRPAMMRIEGIPLIGPPDFLLSLTPKNLKVFLPGKKEFYLGRPVRENLTFFLPVGLSPEDMVNILMGLPPPAADRQLDVRETPPGSKPGLSLFSKGLKVQTLWFTSDGESLASMEIITPEGGEIIVNYGGYRQVGNSRLPEKVTIAAAGKKSRIVVRYHDMTWSQNGDEASFDLPIPAGVTPSILLEQAAGTAGDK